MATDRPAARKGYAVNNRSETEYSKSALLMAVICSALPGLFLLITSTSFLVDGHFVYDIKRVFELGLILVLLVVVLMNTGIRHALAQQLARIPRKLGVVLGLIITLGVISSLVSATSKQLAINSLLEVALLSLLLVSSLIIAACRHVAGRLFDQVAVTLLALAAIAVGFQELLGVTAALLNEVEYFARISLMHYSWPRFYNQVQAWTLPVLGILPLVWAGSRSELMQSVVFRSVVCLLSLGLYWCIILMTGGRGVAISVLLAFITGFMFLPAIRRPTLHWHLSGLLLGAALFFAIAQMNEQVRIATQNPAPPDGLVQQAPAEPVKPRQNIQKEQENRFDSQSMAGRLSLNSSGRLSLWRDAIEYIRHEPLLGIGPMNYACVGPPYRAGHPHNFALQFAAEWGLLATLGLIVVVLHVIRALWIALRTEPDRYETRLASMLATGLMAAALYALLSGVLIMPASQVMAILIAGWLMGALPIKAHQTEPDTKKTAFVVVCALTIALAVTLFSVTELGQREYRESRIALLDQGVPRYWQQGKQCKYFESY